jgi:hypothetical protein
LTNDFTQERRPFGEAFQTGEPCMAITQVRFAGVGFETLEFGVAMASLSLRRRRREPVDLARFGRELGEDDLPRMNSRSGQPFPSATATSATSFGATQPAARSVGLRSRDPRLVVGLSRVPPFEGGPESLLGGVVATVWLCDRTQRCFLALPGLRLFG